MEKVYIQQEPVDNWTLVEIPIPAQAVNRQAVPDQLMLKSYPDHFVTVKSIEVITAKQLTNAVLNNGANAARAEIIKATLVLYCDGWEKVQYIPLSRLIATYDADAATATTIPFMQNPTTFENLRNVDWTKSYIQYANGLNSSGAAYVFILGVKYVIQNNRGEVIKP